MVAAMNWKLFWTVSLAIFFSGVCLYLFVRSREEAEHRQLASAAPEREPGQIGFGAIMAANKSPKQPDQETS